MMSLGREPKGFGAKKFFQPRSGDRCLERAWPHFTDSCGIVRAGARTTKFLNDVQRSSRRRAYPERLTGILVRSSRIAMRLSLA
jgi:hypothetical protein